MKYKIEITKQADADLRGIYEYIAFTLYEPEVAAGQLDRIESAIMSLDEMPERFRLYEKEPWYSRGFRQFPIDNYIIFYISEIRDKTVTVIRVMYGGRDIDEHFKKSVQ